MKAGGRMSKGDYPHIRQEPEHASIFGKRARAMHSSKQYMRSPAFTLPIGAPEPPKPVNKRGGARPHVKLAVQYELLPKPERSQEERERERQMKESEQYFTTPDFRRILRSGPIRY